MGKIDKNNVEDIVGLTPMQQGILYESLKDPENDMYFVQISLKLDGIIIEDYFRKAWEFVMEHNNSLRSIFAWENLSEPVQVILKKITPSIRVDDLSTKSLEYKDWFLEDRKIKDRNERFVLNKGPLFRINLIKLSSSISYVMISFHHILWDGWSTNIILKEFFQYYDHLTKGIEPIITNEKAQFKDYIKWIQSKNSLEESEYWKGYLKGFDTKTSLSSTMISSSNPGKIQGSQITLSNKIVDKLKELSKKQEVTMATILYSAWGLLLQKYNNTDDAVFGTTVSGRPNHIGKIKNSVGLFINTVPLRVKTNNVTRINELLKKVGEELSERYQFESTSLVDIKSYSNIPTESQLFDCIVVYENYPVEDWYRNGIESLKVISYSTSEKTNYSVVVEVSENDEYNINLRYDSQVFDEETINRIKEHLYQVILEILENPFAKTSDLQIITDEEKRQILTMNKSNSDYPNKCVHELFEEQVEKTPNYIAVTMDHNKLTYEELNRRANQMARVLRNNGIKAESIVGIATDRSIEMIISMLAVMKAGGAYLPIDPSYPDDRIKYIVEDSKMECLLVQSKLKEKFQSFSTTNMLWMDDSSLFEGEGTSNLNISSQKNDLAYVIYTSGSTGNPKGVLIEHQSIVNTLTWRAEYYHYTEVDAVLQIPPFVFDSSVGDIFTSLISGAKVVLFRSEDRLEMNKLARLVHEENVTNFLIVPSLYKKFIENLTYDLPSLRFVTLAGEDLTEGLVEDHFKRFDHVDLYNEYGPTENSVASTVYKFDKNNIQVRIGTPIHNTNCYVMDKKNKIQPFGITGELQVSGRGLARGYLGNKGLTNEKFYYNQEMGEKLYKTGDLVKLLPDGELVYIGRVDNQVKIRGNRIELGEIERKLMEHDQIKEAIVTTKDDENNGTKKLVAYIVKKEHITLESIKQFISEKCPNYMVPEYVIFLKEIPLTLNGKIDRKALPNPKGNLNNREMESPINETQEKLVRIWQQLLDRQDIGVHDKFFDVGGDSLKLISLTSLINREFETTFNVKDLFKYPSISSLSKIILKEEKDMKEKKTLAFKY
ncbi:non-ribosomal peptide synthetase [Virgibacillus proomii]|uniref:non-ribosomal peptide synthetase n=1 Tax=Virgibacillus proomii TaxID=84407 RepID=UPI001C11AA42|nr:non-ribosomal peptide synthetase [Virgibacillus proomii]MBU5265930.1 amino acid adenylation domain-containing protein [Virgibacillus proomii]